MRCEHPWFIFLLLGALPSIAQQFASGQTSIAVTGKAVPSGTLSGHVYLSDTKGLARRANVYLQSAASLQIDAPNDHDQGQADGSVAVGVQTRFDGSFFFPHVTAGDYYVIALCPGYVSPYLALALAAGRSLNSSQQTLAPPQHAAREAVLKGIPRITVRSGLSTTVDVTLERGAAISGNISYDDGSPATGLNVEVLARMFEDGKETWGEPILSVRDSAAPSTDDRGNYRINGLPAGKYIIAITFDLSQSIIYVSSTGSSSNSFGNQWTPFKIYSGNTPRLKDATVLSLGPGEEYSGEDLQFPLSKLHTITGHIISAHDGHVINSGMVLLFNGDDKSLAGTTNLSVDSPGFTLNFIYDGEYILTSSNSADVDYQLVPQPPGSQGPPQYNSHPRHRYGEASKPLHVDGDMDGVTIAVPEPSANQAQAFKDALERQHQQNPPPAPNHQER